MCTVQAAWSDAFKLSAFLVIIIAKLLTPSIKSSVHTGHGKLWKIDRNGPEKMHKWFWKVVENQPHGCHIFDPVWCPGSPRSSSHT